MTMRRFIILVIIAILIYILIMTLYFSFGVYIDLGGDEPVTTFAKTKGKNIYIDRGSGFEEFEIRGVDMGSGEPGHWSTDYAIDYDSYCRWFGLIQELGANTFRVYSVQEDIFYNAFYDYNTAREKAGLEPLLLIQGVWVSDYVQFSHMDMYTEEFLGRFIHDSKAMVDVIHGNRDLTLGRLASSGSGRYRKDISAWVIGYLLGVEWEPEVVSYTDIIREDEPLYRGKYMYASENATPFESALARVGDEVIAYETERYRAQRLVSFTNWPTTDPFKYSAAVTYKTSKLQAVDAEHIKTTDAFISGTFASYHIYSYYPDYLGSMLKESELSEEELSDMNSTAGVMKLKWRISQWDAPFIGDYIRPEDYTDRRGRRNSYLAYLKAINRYHTIPVVIMEFGVSTGRGIAQIDENTGRNQGHMSEREQGQAIVECYEDIMEAGCAGGCVFSWQDEWFKRTWNTMYAVDLRRTPYWSDYQTNEQYFGLLSFDPGAGSSVCYVDGNVSEWSIEDVVMENGGAALSMKYDERFVYFMLEKDGLDIENETFYIPIDTTPKSGSNYCRNYDLQFDCCADFLVVISGRDGSCLLVQEYYEALRSLYSKEAYGFDTYFSQNVPDPDSPEFKSINMILQQESRFYIAEGESRYGGAMLFETGKLKYGNANPDSPDFDSLADFIAEGDCIELRIPWQLLNFSDPSRMEIHDDYYRNYGVDYINIDSLNVGVSDGKAERRIPTSEAALKAWGNSVKYHERLKSSYYILKEYWAAE